MSNKKGKIITIFSTKGGVGKTIFTINLAAAYQLLEKKVLIIDLDLYSGGIGLVLNVDENKDIYNFIDDINNKRYTEFKNYIAKYNDYIDVLCCPLDPRQGGKINVQQVENIMMYALNKYDVILIDTSHILSDINLTALDNADQIVLLLSNDPIDLKNMNSVIAIFKDNEKNNYKLILNNAINTDRDYFNIFEMKKIIKNNIDYTINKDFHIKDIDYYLMKGEIPLLTKKIQNKKKKEINRFKQIAINLISEEEINNE
jgi:MinD-like ATPase involved in chromosome partitioning or flagellar assembly